MTEIICRDEKKTTPKYFGSVIIDFFQEYKEACYKDSLAS